MDKYKSLLFLTTILIVLCFIATALFTSRSYFHFYDLSSPKSQNIGAAIGGITAPVIGIFSSVLLYLALIKQIQSNKEQQLKNESDIIFSLFNQLDKEIEGFYYKYRQGEIEHKFYGIEALHEFGKDFRFRYDGFHKSKHGTFSKEVHQSQYLEALIDTYVLIQKRIDISILSEDMKQLFRNKASSYYKGKLKIAFNNFAKTFDEQSYLKDSLSDKFQKFVEMNSY